MPSHGIKEFKYFILCPQTVACLRLHPHSLQAPLHYLWILSYVQCFSTS